MYAVKEMSAIERKAQRGRVEQHRTPEKVAFLKFIQDPLPMSPTPPACNARVGTHFALYTIHYTTHYAPDYIIRN